MDQFANFFHSQNQEKISNNINNNITKDTTAPQMCRYTNL